LAFRVAVSAKEIRSLYSRFQHIDRNRNGFITPTEFQLIPELSMNPLCERIIAILNRDGSERVDFRAFVQALGAFHPRASRSEKQQCAYLGRRFASPPRPHSPPRSCLPLLRH
jgi:Ca2+-binding EF-hand superfamily protein